MTTNLKPLSRRETKKIKMLRDKKALFNQIVTKVPYDDYEKMLLKKQNNIFPVIHDVLFNLIYMFAPISSTVGFKSYSISQDLFSETREFLWGDFLRFYKELKDLENINDEENNILQISFLSAFTTSRIKLDESMLIMFTPIPICVYFYKKNSVNEFMLVDKLVDKIFPLDLKVVIGTLDTIKSFNREKNTIISVDRGIKFWLLNYNRHVNDSFPNKKVEKIPTKKFIEKVRGLLIYLTHEGYMKKGFYFRFCNISLKDICTILYLEKYLEKSMLYLIKKYLNNICEFFKYSNLGYLIYPPQLKTYSIITFEINPFVVNSADWFSYSKESLFWLKTESYIHKVFLEGFSLNEIQEKLQQVLNSYKSSGKFINSYTIDNLVLETFIIPKCEDKKNLTIFNKSLNGLTKKIVYTERTTVKIKNKISFEGSKKIFNVVKNFQSKISFIQKFFDSFENLDALLSLNLNQKFNKKYVLFQKKLSEAINVYFTDILSVINNEDEKVISEIRTYFDRKFSLVQQKASHTSSWYKKSYFFPSIFPLGYKFSYFKQKIKSSKVKTFINRYDRLEELYYETPDNINCAKTSILTFDRDFRKSFQANIAGEFFYEKLYALDIDMSGLHMNLMLCFLNKNSTEIVSWDKLHESFLSNLLGIPNKFIKNYNIDRSIIKEFFLAVLNGRVLLPPSEFYNYEDFKNFEKNPTSLKFFTYFYNFIKNHPLYENCLEFHLKVKSLKFFLGSSFPDTDLKGKINIIFQSLESILLSALIFDLISFNCIIHSLERDGLVVFLNLEQLKSLKFNLFSEVVKTLFNNRIFLSYNLISKKSDRDIV